MTDATPPEGQTPLAALEGALTQLAPVLEAQAREAIGAITALSPDLEEDVRAVLEHMTKVTDLYALRKIDEVTANLAIDNDFSALNLRAQGERNRSKADSFVRGVAILRTIKSVLIATTRLAISVYAPGAGAWVQRLELDKVILDAILPTPRLS